MNRLSRVFLAGLVMVSSLIMPVGAWDKYSFVGDDVYFSGQDAVLRAPAVLAEGVSSSSVSNIDFFRLLSPDFDSLAALIHVHHPEDPGGSVGSVEIPDIPAWDEYRSSPSSGISFSSAYIDGSWDIFQLSTSSFDFAQNLNNGEFEGVRGVITSPYNSSHWNNYFSYSMDLSSFGEFTAFSLSGLITFRAEVNGTVHLLPSDMLSLYVDGRLVRTFYASSTGSYQFGDYFYSSSVPITSISFRFHVPEQSVSDSSGYLRLVLNCNTGVNFVRFDVLSGESILDGQVSDAQDQINDWDSIESEFGSDATEGFNGLDLDNFTYPSDFLAAFSLVSGIFTDLWNCMGDFQIIYLLPLTLGICLLLVGRVSRSSVPSPPPLHTDLPVSNSLAPPSRPALKGGKR